MLTCHLKRTFYRSIYCLLENVVCIEGSFGNQKIFINILIYVLS
jgi:hypothetical protein